MNHSSYSGSNRLKLQQKAYFIEQIVEKRSCFRQHLQGFGNWHYLNQVAKQVVVLIQFGIVDARAFHIGQ